MSDEKRIDWEKIMDHVSDLMLLTSWERDRDRRGGYRQPPSRMRSVLFLFLGSLQVYEKGTDERIKEHAKTVLEGLVKHFENSFGLVRTTKVYQCLPEDDFPKSKRYLMESWIQTLAYRERVQRAIAKATGRDPGRKSPLLLMLKDPEKTHRLLKEHGITLEDVMRDHEKAFEGIFEGINEDHDRGHDRNHE